MGTKLKPGAFDCYAAARPDEPIFTLMARDRSAPLIVRAWARKRRDDILTGEAHDAPLTPGDEEDLRKATEAEAVADDMTMWRRNNYGVWKGQLQRVARPQVTDELRGLVEEAARNIVGALAGIPSAFQTGLELYMATHRVTSSPAFHAFRHDFTLTDPLDRLGTCSLGPIPDGLVTIPGLLILDGNLIDAEPGRAILQLITVPA